MLERIKKTRNTFGEYTNFSELVSEVYHLAKSINELHDDIDMWYAPSECHSLVDRSITKNLAAILDKGNITPTGFWDEMETRIGNNRLQLDILDWDSVSKIQQS